MSVNFNLNLGQVYSVEGGQERGSQREVYLGDEKNLSERMVSVLTHFT
jgi:hypothetical protein